MSHDSRSAVRRSDSTNENIKKGIVGGGGAGAGIVALLLYAISANNSGSTAPNTPPEDTHGQTVATAPKAPERQATHKATPAIGAAACDANASKVTLDITEGSLRQLITAAQGQDAENNFRHTWKELGGSTLPCEVHGVSAWYDRNHPAQQDLENSLIDTLGSAIFKQAMVGGALKGTVGTLEIDGPAQGSLGN